MNKNRVLIPVFVILCGTLWTYESWPEPIFQTPQTLSECLPSTDTHNGDGKIENCNEKGTEYWSPTWGAKVKITDSLLALFTFILAIFTGFLWNSTRQLVKGAEDTSERQLRAYVIAVQSRIVNFGPNKIPGILVLVKNCGQTPASYYSHKSSMGFDRFPPSVQSPAIEDSVGGSVHVLAPNMEIKQLIKFHRALQQHEVDEIRKGEAALYVVGRISYKDIFDRNRTTDYKLFGNGESNININGSMSAWTEGNHYT